VSAAACVACTGDIAARCLSVGLVEMPLSECSCGRQCGQCHRCSVLPLYTQGDVISFQSKTRLFLGSSCSRFVTNGSCLLNIHCVQKTRHVTRQILIDFRFFIPQYGSMGILSLMCVFVCFCLFFCLCFCFYVQLRISQWRKKITA